LSREYCLRKLQFETRFIVIQQNARRPRCR